MVEPSKPVLVNVVVAEVPTCTKLLQAAPVQRSMRYWLMVPPVSVAAVQERLICTGPEAVAVRLPGAVGKTPVPMGVRKVTICMTHWPAELRAAVVVL